MTFNDPLPSERQEQTDLAPLRRLEVVSAIEAVTLIVLLFVAVPLKYLSGWPIGVRAMGPVHGLAFLSFCWLALQAVASEPASWTGADRLRLFLGAVIPFGGLWNARFISGKARIARARVSR